jgi:hypothetical protein
MTALAGQLERELTQLDRVRAVTAESKTSNDYTDSAYSDFDAMEDGTGSGASATTARCEELAQTLLDQCQQLHNSGPLDTVTNAKVQNFEQTARGVVRQLQRMREQQAEKVRQKEVMRRLLATSATQQVLDRNGEAGLAMLAREHDVLTSSLNTVSDSIAMASNSLDSLRRQHFTLKNARRKLLDVATSLGLSRRTIQWIEQQENVNNLIFVGGSIFVLVCVFCFYYWWTSSDTA